MTAKVLCKLAHTGSTLTLHKYESVESGVLLTVYIPKDKLPEKPPLELEVRMK